MKFINAPIDKNDDKIYKTDSKLSLYQSKLKFNFENISFGRKRCCFNNDNISSDDFVNLLEFLKFLSNKTVQCVIDDKKNFHFHNVNLSIKYCFKDMFFKAINIERVEEVPTFYQIAVFTDKKATKSRLVFTLDENGVINLIFYDHEHLIYFDENINENKYEIYKDYM